MKKLNSLFVMLLFIATTAFAQIPQAINFQAIARDGNGDILANTPIAIRLSILDGSATGTQVYQEVRSVDTNGYGSFSFQIGVNPLISSGDFSAIAWETGNKFMKVDYDPTASLQFNLTLGTIEFATVPYAFAAAAVSYIDLTGVQDGDVLLYNAATGKFEPGQITAGGSVEWSNITNKPTFATVATSGSYDDLTGRPNIDGSETKIAAGTNVIVSGSGTAANPYVINVTGASLLAPIATAAEASDVSYSTATLNGNVNANNLKTAVIFEYGTTTAYEYGTVTASPSQVVGTSVTHVSANLSGLQYGSEFHYRLKAENAVDASYSSDMQFSTTSPSAMYSVLFQLDLSSYSLFAPSDVYYLTGSFTNWATPGAAGSLTLRDTDGDLIYTTMVQLPAGVEHEYKFFQNSGWNGGEWLTGANRKLIVTSDVVVYNLWADETSSETVITIPISNAFDSFVGVGNIGGSCIDASCNNNGWYTHANSMPATIDIIPGSLAYPGLAASAGNKAYISGNTLDLKRDVNKPISVAGNIIYTSVLINIIDNSNLSTTGFDHFFHLGAVTK